MNLPNGLYADGTVKPGGKFDPPTGGTHYAGPFGGVTDPMFYPYSSRLLDAELFF